MQQCGAASILILKDFFATLIRVITHFFIMGLLSDIFDFLIEQTSDNYISKSERWFDSVWKHLNRTDSAEGILEVRDGNLFRRLSVTFRDGTKISIIDVEDEGCSLRSVNLDSNQRRQLIRDGRIVLKEYE